MLGSGNIMVDALGMVSHGEPHAAATLAVPTAVDAQLVRTTPSVRCGAMNTMPLLLSVDLRCLRNTGAFAAAKKRGNLAPKVATTHANYPETCEYRRRWTLTARHAYTNVPTHACTLAKRCKLVLWIPSPPCNDNVLKQHLLNRNTLCATHILPVCTDHANVLATAVATGFLVVTAQRGVDRLGPHNIAQLSRTYATHRAFTTRSHLSIKL